jgi:hypothetical protein
VTTCPHCGKSVTDEPIDSWLDPELIGVRNYNPVLVDMSVAMQQLRLESSTIMEMIESGALLWVWDLSAKDSIRPEIRFWFGELLQPKLCRRRSLGAVLEMVVGHGTQHNLRASTVSNILLITRQTVHNLCDSGALRGHLEDHTLWIQRQSLIDFLRARLCTPKS